MSRRPDTLDLPVRPPAEQWRVAKALVRRPGAIFGLVVVFCAIVAAAWPTEWLPYDPRYGEAQVRYQPPIFLPGGRPSHLLGTDGTGRDQLSVLIAGSRTSLAIIVGASVVGLSAGVTLGMIAGYYGGWRSAAAMRLADLQLSFPSIILIIVVVAAIGNDLSVLTLILGLSAWPVYARIVFTSVLALKERQFVEAARAVGLTDTRIMTRHLLPNVVPVLAVVATVGMSTLMLTEASLSYIGLGVQPPTPAWGAMIADARPVIFTTWWASVLPGTCIVVLVFAFSLIGDELRTVLAPTVSGRRS